MSANPSSQEWNAQYDAVVQAMRAGGGQAGIMTPEMARGKTGLALLQAMLAGTLPYAPIADTIDFALIEVAQGSVIFQGTPQFKHYNPLGSVHGASGFGTRLCGTDDDAGGAQLYDRGARRQYRARSEPQNRTAACNWKGAALRTSVGHCRGAHRGRRG